jgi:uncharacterized protein DUF1360
LNVASFYWLILGILGVWRVTHLLAAEDGPWDAIARIRLRLGHGVWGRLLDCFYCLSLWIAAAFAWTLGASVKESLLLWLAMSGGAILLERATAQRAPREPREPFESLEPFFWEDDSNGLLRKNSNDGEPAGFVDH